MEGYYKDSEGNWGKDPEYQGEVQQRLPENHEVFTDHNGDQHIIRHEMGG